MNPDTGTVIVSPTLKEGTRVVCPSDQYGTVLNVDGWEVRVTGKTWRDIDDEVIARQSEEDAIVATIEDGKVVPFGGRTLVEFVPQTSFIQTLKPTEDLKIIGGEHDGWFAVTIATPLRFRFKDEHLGILRLDDILAVYLRDPVAA